MSIHEAFKSVLAGGLLACGLLIATASAEVNVPPAPFPAIPGNAEIDPTVGADIGTKGYHVSEIRGGVYWITDGNYHAMAIKHRHGVVLVDAPEPLPFFPPMPVLSAVAEIAPDEPITHMIYSHAHTDHIGGAGAVKAAFPHVKIIAHEKTLRELKKIKDPRRPIPDETFSLFKPMSIGGQRINLHYFGNTHQAGNAFINLPRQKILMAVDVIYPGWVPFRRLALSEDIRGWLKGHEAILKFDFDTLLTGHLTRMGTREDVETAMEYNADIKAYIEEVYRDPNNTLFAAVGAIDAVHGAGVSFSTVAKWALFSAFYDASTMNCADKLNAKWNGTNRLAGGESFNFSNCEAYFVALRLGDVEAPPAP